MTDVLPWISVLLGLVLSATGLYSTFYFGRESRELKGNWVLQVVYRTVATITAAGMVLTFTSAYALAFGPAPWTRIVNGLMVIWLLLIPILKYRVFHAHEGLPYQPETALEEEDREAGVVRREEEAS